MRITPNLKQLESFYLIFYFAGMLINMGLFYFWWLELSLIWLLVIHLLSTLISYGGLYALYKKRVFPRKEYPIYFFGIFMQLLLPPLGGYATFLAVVFYYFTMRVLKRELYGDYEEFLQGRYQAEELPEKHDNLMRVVRRETGFESFVDIIRGDDLYNKLKVLQKLRQNVTHKSILLLKEATQDLLPEVRLFAAQALLGIEDKLNKDINLQKIKADSIISAEEYAKLGDLYLLYVDLDILEEAVKKHYLLLASSAYKASLDESTQNLEVILKYAKVLNALGQASKAKLFLDHAYQIWPESIDLNLLRAEVAFQTKNYGDIEKILKHVDIEEVEKIQENFKEPIMFWIGDE